MTYKRDAGEVPEYEHETVLLVEDIPGLRDALLAFGASIDVQTGRQDHERGVLKSGVLAGRVIHGRMRRTEETYP